LDIRPDPAAEWGERPEDAAKVFLSAAGELWRHFPEGNLKPILVEPRGGPITLHRRGPNGEYLVRLNTGNRLWAQHAYQFAHEFTHILCNYAPHEHRNRWLEESLCEAGSLFALRGMAETWRTRPPYPNWSDYAPHLADYARQRIDAARLPPGKTLAAWYRENAAVLAADAVQREKNNVVAAALLPLFEEDPGRWESVRWLNDGKPRPAQTLAEFLDQWHDRAPAKHRAFLRRIAEELGVEIKGPAKQQVGQSYWTQGSAAPLGSIDGWARRRVLAEEFAYSEDEADERARALRFLALSNLPNLLFCRPKGPVNAAR
jgi:hypothetical protein